MIFSKLKHGYKLRSSILKKSFNKIIRKKHRPGQRKFREKLIKKYDSKCALLGIHASLCDAAHILPYSECKSSQDKYDENNGILLSATLHKAYDKNYFWIDENTCQIKINYSALKKDNIENLQDIGLNGFEDFYVSKLDNKYGKEFLKKRNETKRNN